MNMSKIDEIRAEMVKAMKNKEKDRKGENFLHLRIFCDSEFKFRGTNIQKRRKSGNIKKSEGWFCFPSSGLPPPTKHGSGDETPPSSRI